MWTKTTTTLYYVIPAGSSSKYSIKIKTAEKSYNINFSSAFLDIGFGKSDEEKEEIFSKLVYVLDNLIKPFIIINLLVTYSEVNELKIGDSLTINPKGFYKNRFWGGSEFLPWDQYYNSILQSGLFYIYREDEKKKYKEYFTCSMDTMNAVVMPDLLKFLFQKDGTVDKKTKEELLKRKEEFSKAIETQTIIKGGKRSCSSCGVYTESDQKFCTHCGSKLT